jgi:hypothetical protein
MALCKFTLELKVELPDEHYDMFVDAIQTTAKVLIAKAAIASPKKPEIALFGDDFMRGTQDIELFTPKEQEENAATSAGNEDAGGEWGD